jgi:hypothetical protein
MITETKNKGRYILTYTRYGCGTHKRGEKEKLTSTQSHMLNGECKRLKQGDVTIAFYYVWDETDKCNTSLLGISFPVDLKNRFI